MLQTFQNQQVSSTDADIKKEFLIDYVGSAKSQHFVKVDVEELRKMIASGLSQKSVLKDKMVILGGDYSAQDEHNTPVGLMTGVEVLASIAETEQHGGGRQPLTKFAFVLLAIFDSIVLLSLIYLIGFWKTIVISIVLIPTLGVLLSLVFFGSLNYAGSLVLGLIAVLCYEIYERARDYFKKSREQATEAYK
jgi:CHASE2 domain